MKFLATICAALLIGCASVSTPTPSGTIGASYEAIKTYQRNVGVATDRGRINSATSFRLIAEGEKARKSVDDARDALALCGGKLPCDSFESIMRRLQPMLAEMERKLREEEAKK